MRVDRERHTGGLRDGLLDTSGDAPVGLRIWARDDRRGAASLDERGGRAIGPELQYLGPPAFRLDLGLRGLAKGHVVEPDKTAEVVG